MSFEVDNQTAKDLNLFPNSENSIFQFLNFTNTKKGELSLIDKISKPTSNIQIINDRIETIQFFYDYNIKFTILQKDLEFLEYYLALDFRLLKDSFVDAIRDKIKSNYVFRNDYFLIERGIAALINLLNHIKQEVSKFENKELPTIFKAITSKIHAVLEKPTIAASLKLNTKHINFRNRNRFDKVFRYTHKEDIEKLLDLIYEWDVLHSLKLAMQKNKFSLPLFEPFNNNPVLKIKGLFHPVISNPIKNDLLLDSKSNLCFLTGSNMSGKSTLLKALGISIYLAHLGFPVPATQMKLTPFNGLITTINLSDNINLGYSHYFSEVRRVKYISEQLTLKKNMFVIVDEMFRGTNVEEAHYATNIISSAFANIASSIFLFQAILLKLLKNLNTMRILT